MLFPIKIKLLRREKLSLTDIINSDPIKKLNALNSVRIGRIYKTTAYNRFPLTINFLGDRSNFYDIIHDIGCSDGTSSLDLIKKLNFHSFFCLDKYIKLKLGFHKSNPVLMDWENNVHMYENKYALFYLDPFKIHYSPFEYLVSKFFSKKNFYSNLQSKVVELINPKLNNYPNVYFRNFDIFEDDLEKKSDLIVVFNLLNKFTHKKIQKKCLHFFKKNLNTGGLVVIGENQPEERASIYEKKDNLNLIKTINGGSNFKL